MFRKRKPMTLSQLCNDHMGYDIEVDEGLGSAPIKGSLQTMFLTTADDPEIGIAITVNNEPASKMVTRKYNAGTTCRVRGF